MKEVTAILIGAGSRGTEYASYGVSHPGELKIVAVAEPVKERRNRVAEWYGISGDMQFDDYPELLAKGKIADCAVIATQDRMHFEPAMAAMELGYDILLEKPMSPSLDECIAMAKKAEEKGVLLSLCYVLRYTPMYRKIKELIDAVEIGRLIAIQHSENVGFWHQAHSFVRGNWRNSSSSCPMILAKSCHDMDILYYLVGAAPVSVASFGGLNWFKKESAPEDAAERCVDCKYSGKCPYDATGLYLGENTSWPVDVITTDISYEGRVRALRTGPYGRCAYRCDNDVVDNQVSIITFANGVHVSFTMCAFTHDITRCTRVMGSHGEIIAEMDGAGEVKLYKFENAEFMNPDPKNRPACIDVPVNAGEDVFGHGGGDMIMMREFTAAVREHRSELLSSARDAVYSHIMAFAAEKGRLENRVVNISGYDLV